MDKRAFKVLIASLVLVPVSVLLPYIPTFRFLGVTDFWYVQYITFLFLLLLGVTVYLWGFSKPLSLLTGLSLFSSMVVAKQAPVGLFHCFMVYLSVLAIYAISQTTVKQRMVIRKAVIVVASIYCIMLILQILNLDPFFIKLDSNGLPMKGIDDPVGFSGSKNMSGAFFSVIGSYLAFTLPIITPLMVLGLWMSKSSFAIAGFIAGSSLLLFKNKWWKGILILMSIVISIFFWKFETNPINAISGRLQPDKAAIQAIYTGHIGIVKEKVSRTIKANPYFGYGIGNFIRIFPYVPQNGFNGPRDKYVHLHNDYIEWVFEMGYLGLIVLVWLIIDFLVKAKRLFAIKEARGYLAAIFSYLVCACGLFVSHVAVGSLWLMLFYGMFLSKYREIYGKTTPIC
jgi:hypothetical protein